MISGGFSQTKYNFMLHVLCGGGGGRRGVYFAKFCTGVGSLIPLYTILIEKVPLSYTFN